MFERNSSILTPKYIRPYCHYSRAAATLLMLTLSLCLSLQAGQGQDSTTLDNYPRITAMESAILGKSYAGEALPARLARMEVKAFGKSADKADLSDRTDSLQTYVETTLHKPMVVPGPGYQEEGDSDQPPLAGASGRVEQTNAVGAAAASYPRVTALEQAILEQVYESDSLPERLGRMEVKAFGKVAADSALGDRTDALEDYAEKKLHKKILGQSSTTVDSAESGGNNAGAGTSGGGSFLAKMGSALLGIPSGGMPASGGPSFFAPGFGPFGGVRVRPRSAVDTAQTQSAPANAQPSHQPTAADQAIIDAATPPAPSVRLATKVAWCEQRVFGQASYEKHLTDRLSLLNSALRFDPGKTGLGLMDDIDKLIKAAEAFSAKVN